MDCEEPSSLAEQFGESCSDEDGTDSDLEAKLYALVYHSEDLYDTKQGNPEQTSITTIADVVNSWKNVSNKEKSFSGNDASLQKNDKISSKDKNSSEKRTPSSAKDGCILGGDKISSQDANKSDTLDSRINVVGTVVEEGRKDVTGDNNSGDLPCRSTTVPMNEINDNLNGERKGQNENNSPHIDEFNFSALLRSNRSDNSSVSEKRLTEITNSQSNTNDPMEQPKDKVSSNTSKACDSLQEVAKSAKSNVLSTSSSDDSSSSTTDESENTSMGKSENPAPTPKKMLSESSNQKLTLLKSTKLPSSANSGKSRHRVKAMKSNAFFDGPFVATISSSDSSSSDEESRYNVVAKKKNINIKGRVNSFLGKLLSSENEPNEIITIEDSDESREKFDSSSDSDESVLVVPPPPKPKPLTIIVQDSDNSCTDLDDDELQLDCLSSDSNRSTDQTNTEAGFKSKFNDSRSVNSDSLDHVPVSPDKHAVAIETMNLGLSLDSIEIDRSMGVSSESRSDNPNPFIKDSEINSDLVMVSPEKLAKEGKSLKSGIVSESNNSEDSMTENEAMNWGIIAETQTQRNKSNPIGTCEETDILEKNCSPEINVRTTEHKDSTSERRKTNEEVPKQNPVSLFSRDDNDKPSGLKFIEIDNKFVEHEDRTIDRNVDLFESNENMEQSVEKSKKSSESRKRLLDAIEKPGNNVKRARHSDGDARPSTSGTGTRKENDTNRGKRRKSMSDCFFEPMTDEMKDFYNKSWGGENFDLDDIRSKMSKDPRHWAVLDEDLIGSHRGRARYWINGKCTNCQRPGHTRATCSEPRKQPRCHMCGDQGHREPRCPYKICLTCGKKQKNYVKTCESCRHTRCTICGALGHYGDYCPDLWRRYHQTPSRDKPNCAKTQRQDLKRKSENENKQRLPAVPKVDSNDEFERLEKLEQLKLNEAVQGVLESSLNTNKVDHNQNSEPSLNPVGYTNNLSNVTSLLRPRNIQVRQSQSNLNNFPDMSITIPNIPQVPIPQFDNNFPQGHPVLSQYDHYENGNIQLVQNNPYVSIKRSHSFENGYSVLPHGESSKDETIQFNHPHIPFTNSQECFNNSDFSHPLIPSIHSNTNFSPSNVNIPFGNFGCMYQNPSITQEFPNSNQWNPNMPFSNSHVYSHTVSGVPQGGLNFSNQYEVQAEPSTPNLCDNPFVSYLHNPCVSNITSQFNTPFTNPNNNIQQFDMINISKYSSSTLQLISSNIPRNIINIPMLQPNAIQMNRGIVNLNTRKYTNLIKLHSNNTSHSNIPDTPRDYSVPQLISNNVRINPDIPNTRNRYPTNSLSLCNNTEGLIRLNQRKHGNQNRNPKGTQPPRQLPKNILSLDPNDGCEVTRLILFETRKIGHNIKSTARTARNTAAKIKIESRKSRRNRDMNIPGNRKSDKKKCENSKAINKNGTRIKDTATKLGKNGKARSSSTENVKRKNRESSKKRENFKTIKSVCNVKIEQHTNVRHDVAESLKNYIDDTKPNTDFEEGKETQDLEFKNFDESLISQMILTPSKDALLRQTADGRDYLESLANNFKCVIRIEEKPSVPHLKVLSIYGERDSEEIIRKIKKWFQLPFDETTLGYASLPNDREKIITILSEKLRDLDGFLGTPLNCLDNINTWNKAILELSRSGNTDLRHQLTRSKLTKKINYAKVKLNMILFGQAKLNGGEDLIYFLKTTLWTLKYVQKEKRLEEEVYKNLCFIYRRIFSAYIPTNLDDLLNRYNYKGYKSYYGN